LLLLILPQSLSIRLQYLLDPLLRLSTVLLVVNPLRLHLQTTLVKKLLYLRSYLSFSKSQKKLWPNQPILHALRSSFL
jgi:hypothetical protein